MAAVVRQGHPINEGVYLEDTRQESAVLHQVQGQFHGPGGAAMPF